MRLAAALVAIGASLITFAPNASATGDPSWATPRENRIAWDVLHLINRERVAHDVPPVGMGRRLRLSAYRHDTRMRYFNELSHQLPGEPPFGQRISNTGYVWIYAGENIAFNSDQSRAGVLFLERLMYNERPPSDDHRLNILSRNYWRAGVDVLFDPGHGKVWLTVDFAHPA